MTSMYLERLVIHHRLLYKMDMVLVAVLNSSVMSTTFIETVRKLKEIITNGIFIFVYQMQQLIGKLVMHQNKKVLGRISSIEKESIRANQQLNK
jgi:hypothetical protein